jgi:hypothetical protein
LSALAEKFTRINLNSAVAPMLERASDH